MCATPMRKFNRRAPARGVGLQRHRIAGCRGHRKRLDGHPVPSAAVMAEAGLNKLYPRWLTTLTHRAPSINHLGGATFVCASYHLIPFPYGTSANVMFHACLPEPGSVAILHNCTGYGHFISWGSGGLISLRWRLCLISLPMHGIYLPSPYLLLFSGTPY